MTYRLVSSSAFLLALSLVGCGGGGNTVNPTIAANRPGPHGGMAFPLPADRGHVEVVVEKPANWKPGGKSSLVVYFLDATASGPITVTPSDVTVKVQLPSKPEPETVTLAASTDKKASEVKYASVPGDYDFDTMSGDVTATLDGQPVTVPFMLR
jgi:hypothetical protein